MTVIRTLSSNASYWSYDLYSKHCELLFNIWKTKKHFFRLCILPLWCTINNVWSCIGALLHWIYFIHICKSKYMNFFIFCFVQSYLMNIIRIYITLSPFSWCIHCVYWKRRKINDFFSNIYTSYRSRILNTVEEV